MADSKISELTPKSSGISDITDSASDIWIPISVGTGSNGKINLKILITAIKALLAPDVIATSISGNTSAKNSLRNSLGIIAIENDLENGGGGGSGEGGSSSLVIQLKIAALEQRASSLEQSVGNLQNVNNWPVNHIVLTDTTSLLSISYPLPTGPGLQSGEVVIKQSNVNIPNFYVTYCMSIPTITLGGQLYTGVTITVSNQSSGLNLIGGQIGTIKITGTMIGEVAGLQSSYEVEGTYTAWSSRTLSPGDMILDQVSNGDSPVAVMSSNPVPSGFVLRSATLYCLFGTDNNSPKVAGSNVYINSGSSSAIMPTSGYITMPNGS